MSGFEVQTASLTPELVRRAALHAAYYLVEAVQLQDVGAARVEIADRLVEAERCGWPETTATLLYALAVDAFYNFPDDAATAIGTVIDTAEALGEALGEAGILAAGLCLQDPLTGLGNRRALEQRLGHECDSLTPQTTISMMIIDIDQFKGVNDRFGHACGDAVLCRVAAIIRSALRPDDLALRLGGDEFCAVLTGASPEVVQDRADRIGTLVSLEDWGALALGLAVTVSVGAASATGAGAVADLYPRADAALYAAKAAGAGLLRIAL